MTQETKAPPRPFAISVERRADGAALLKARETLQAYPRCTTERLVYWAERAPDRVFIGKRARTGEWQTITYGDALRRVRRISQALLARGLSAERPAAILSGNDIEHALLSLAAQHVGILCVPVSPAYSLISSDFARLRHIMALVTPGLVFAADGNAYGKALETAVPAGTEIILTEESNLSPSGPCTLFGELEEKAATEAVDRAYRAVGPEVPAKIMFTSGSTGLPKGVITTHRMLCSTQQMFAQMLPQLTEAPIVLVDWLPWHHSFGGSNNFGKVLHNGGSLYVDDGRPVPGGMDETIRNLKEIAPTIYFNVPKGYEGLIPFFHAEPEFRNHFFSRMKFLFYAGASLSEPTWNELRELSRQARGECIPILTSMGASETGPGFLLRSWDVERPGNIGLPMPGTIAKLVPSGSKLEIRVQGPNVTPGYWREPEKTRSSFDEEDFYKMGDAVCFADPNDSQKGLEFDGRIAEDFKLSSGTWVNAGQIRLKILQREPSLIRDTVIAGHDQDYLGMLIFPNLEACRNCCRDLPADAAAPAILCRTEVRERIQQLINALRAESTGISSRIERAILLVEPPSIDANEITDKGSINQRAVLERRAALVNSLFEEPCPPHVIVAN